MMQHIQLSKGDDYQDAVATLRSAEMLAAWLRGTPAPRRVGSEHFAIPGWDDIVVEESDGARVHYQVKSNATHFDTRPADRRKKAGAKDPDKDPSEFDKTLRALATATAAANWNGVVDGRLRRFEIAVVSDMLCVKKDLTLAQVVGFVDRARKDGQVAAWLAAQSVLHGTTKAVVTWLKEWCDFADEAHIWRGLHYLTIRSPGTNVALEGATEKVLAKLFSDPVHVRKSIKSFLRDNKDPTQATTPQLLLQEVEPYLLSEYRRWVFYHYDPLAPRWAVGGTLGFSTDRPGLPAKVVSTLWSGEQSARELRIAAKPAPGDLNPVLLRLAVHAEAFLTEVSLTDPSAWKQRVGGWIGGTLGLATNDDVGTNWQALAQTDPPIDPHALEGQALFGHEATALRTKMDEVTWSAVVLRVNTGIKTYGATDLNDAMEAVWKRWRQDLAAADRAQLMCQLLSANAERSPGFDATLRVGPRSVDLLAGGILLHLAVAAALDPDKGVHNSISGQAARTIALERCTSLLNPHKDRAKIVDQAMAVLSAETAPIVVLSATDATCSELIPDSVMDDERSSMRLTAAKIPELVITPSVRYTHAKDRGITHLKHQLDSQRNKFTQAREELIRQCQPEVGDAP